MVLLSCTLTKRLSTAMNTSQVFGVPGVACPTSVWTEIMSVAPKRLAPTDEDTPRAWTVTSAALELAPDSWAYCIAEKVQMVAAYSLDTAPAGSGGPVNARDTSTATILPGTALGLVCAKPGAADASPAARYDLRSGSTQADLTNTVWIRRAPAARNPPGICRCAICRTTKSAPSYGCANCMAAIHCPRKHVTMGLPMCDKCSKAAGGSPAAPDCPACQQSAGGCTVPCHVCGRAYHASSCSGGFTAYASGSTQRVCPKLICRVAHRSGKSRCCACQMSLSGSHTPIQCTKCLRVWCQRMPSCSISLQQPILCGSCRKASRDRPDHTPLRDEGPQKRPRGGNQ